MKCPGCGGSRISVRQRLLIAARAESRCPACGVVIRLGYWPRLLQTLFGEGLLLLGIVGAFLFEAPFLMVLATGSWLSLAVLLPTEPNPSRAHAARGDSRE